MRVGLFIFFSFIYAIGLGIFVYAYASNTFFVIEFFGIRANLPVALWIVMPLVLYSFFAMAHFGFYSFLLSRKFSKVQFDLRQLPAVLRAKILKEEFKFKPKSLEGKEVFWIIKDLQMNSDTFETRASFLPYKETLMLFKRIESGEYVENAILPSPYDEKNFFNRFNKNKEDVEWIVSNPKKVPQKLLDEALRVFAAQEKFSRIKKMRDYLKVEHINILLERISDVFEVNTSEIIASINKVEYSSKEVVKFSKILSQKISDDERLAIFKDLKTQSMAFETAFIYTLLDISDLQSARAFFKRSDLLAPHTKLKAYLDLKEDGKDYPLELFI